MNQITPKPILLCPVDYSESTELAISIAVGLAKAGEMKMVLLHVVDPDEPAISVNQSVNNQLLARLRTHYLDLHGVDWEQVTRRGDPAQTTILVWEFWFHPCVQEHSAHRAGKREQRHPGTAANLGIDRTRTRAGDRPTSTKDHPTQHDAGVKRFWLVHDGLSVDRFCVELFHQKHRNASNDNSRSDDQVHERFFEQEHVVNALPTHDFRLGQHHPEVDADQQYSNDRRDAWK